MASWMDLRPECERLDVGCTYIQQPAQWVTRLVTDAFTRPCVVNVKGFRLERTCILMSFEEYKKLREAARGEGRKE